jgi:hypothetical protein
MPQKDTLDDVAYYLYARILSSSLTSVSISLSAVIYSIYLNGCGSRSLWSGIIFGSWSGRRFRIGTGTSTKRSITSLNVTVTYNVTYILVSWIRIRIGNTDPDLGGPCSFEE